MEMYQKRAKSKAILAELVQRCHDSELSRYSAGIVTFNISQQNLIEGLLTKDCGRALRWSNRPTSRRSRFSLKVWKMFKVINGVERDSMV